MKKFIALFLVLAVGVAAPAQPANALNLVGKLPPLVAVVDYIIDGDTLIVWTNMENGARIRTKVRFINIDAPEMSGECQSEIDRAMAARDRLKEILPKGREIKLDKIKNDKYLGRINAFVLAQGRDENGDKTGDWRDVGKQLVDEGHAVKYSGGKRKPWCTAAEITEFQQKSSVLLIDNR